MRVLGGKLSDKMFVIFTVGLGRIFKPLVFLNFMVHHCLHFRKPKEGVRKIVISTNISETSITIDDCIFVIDSGKMKEKGFDSNRNMESLDTVWVTKANALQRKGRAGRVMSGVCIHLFTGHRYQHHLLDQPIPEIKRVPLEQLILHIKILPNFANKSAEDVLG